jgi:hypothetical protein
MVPSALGKEPFALHGSLDVRRGRRRARGKARSSRQMSAHSQCRMLLWRENGQRLRSKDLAVASRERTVFSPDSFDRKQSDSDSPATVLARLVPCDYCLFPAILTQLK